MAMRFEEIQVGDIIVWRPKLPANPNALYGCIYGGITPRERGAYVVFDMWTNSVEEKDFFALQRYMRDGALLKTTAPPIVKASRFSNTRYGLASKGYHYPSLNEVAGKVDEPTIDRMIQQGKIVIGIKRLESAYGAQGGLSEV